MSEDRGKYKGFTRARAKANKKYDQESVDRISIRLPKGQREVLKRYCAEHNTSLNKFVNEAIREKMDGC